MLWQTVPATEKARSLTVDSRVRRTDSDSEEAELRCQMSNKQNVDLYSAFSASPGLEISRALGAHQSSARYDSAVP